MTPNQNKMEQDFLNLLKQLQRAKTYDVQVNTPMGEDTITMIEKPSYQIRMIMLQHFPEELI